MEDTEAFGMLDQCFYAWGRDHVAKLREGDLFAHYTSAGVAMKIIQAKGADEQCLWLRNARLMNDFAEIDYGRSILVETFRVFRQSFEAICDAVHPSIKSVLDEIDAEAALMKETVYLLSLARHEGAERFMGKLSMWRAYGGDANVCVLLDPKPFLAEQEAYDVDFAPVFYGGPAGIQEEIARMISAMNFHLPALRQVDPTMVKLHIKNAFDAIVLSSKHPGLKEEQEWRVILKRRLSGATHSTPSKIVDVGGIQQEVFYLPMRDVPEKGLLGASPQELIRRIIIGPTPNPPIVALAFMRALNEAGIADPSKMVVQCGIPLRR